ncbi:class I adenylate-forming enzyme family protein [Sedimenticola selenatireducens]|uniref:AMP-binding protein n=1 Tax=Sedimenticola selenatireducens TaxID=191960 RepID=A0A557SH91_9GAMM|nr:AMP-binding protein [Sedimenticola selenatireducens]TVO76789.1 AMP-binding protein [Sedimenticola selenatireducens]TVT64232.1 MAG: AMP-binding protein [Sedimenticola selenatireducens]
MLITEILSRNGRMYADEIALIERDPEINSRREISWRVFDQEANRFANALIACGVRKGDRVLHLMMNSLEWLPCYFGVLRSGAIVAPLNFRFESEIIQASNDIVEARVLLFGPEFIERICEVKAALDRTIEHYIYIGPERLCPDFAVDYACFVDGEDSGSPQLAIDLMDDAALYFTSGTTGLPKAVSLTHRNLEHACYVENQHHRQTHEDNFLCIPPLYHTGAKMHWFGNFLVGAKAVLLKGARPDWVLKAVSEEQATIVWLLVPWAHDILIAWENGDIDFGRYKLDQWRLMHIGAQPVPPNLIKAWRKLFPHHEYDTNYGLTESTGPGCLHLGLGNTHKIGSIGKPGFDWEACIVDDSNCQLPPGEPGELIVKGPGVMRGYYRNPEATREALRDGWLHTGDIAMTDTEGFIWLVDRKKDLIITGGENVSPVEVEHFFMEHPHIQDVAVIGTPDQRLGEIVTAIIQLKPGCDMTDEEATVFAQRLPKYKRPRCIHFDLIPRNATGKIEKPKLRERYGVLLPA